MKLSNLYADKIAHLSPVIQEAILREAPHTRIDHSTIPPELAFLKGAFIDLGFENLGLPSHEFRQFMQAFVSHGVKMPGTECERAPDGYKLRYTRTGVTVIEPSHYRAIELPANWREVVLVLNDNNDPIYVGKLVRPDQVGASA